MRDDDHGAILLLERGAAEIAVRRQADTRRSVSAEPFAVEVTGTLESAISLVVPRLGLGASAVFNEIQGRPKTGYRGRDEWVYGASMCRDRAGARAPLGGE